MSRRRSPLVAVAGLLVAAGLSGCLEFQAPVEEQLPPDAGDSTPAQLPPPSPPGRLEPACPPPAQPGTLSAEEMNAALFSLDLPNWQSADVGASAPLSDGRIAWFYGDTVGSPEVEPRLVSNSVLVTSGTCTSQLVLGDGTPTPVVPETGNGLSTWPMSVVRVPPTEADGPGVADVLLVYSSRVQRGARMWDFAYRGTTVAVFTVTPGGVPQLARTAALTPDSIDLGQVNWGAASAADGDWVYVYGTRATGEAYVYGRELYVARLPVARATDGSAMQYWDGTGWQDDATRAAPVLGALDGVAQTLSVDRVGDRWLAVSKLGGDLGDSIAIWSADGPTGPWTVQPVLSSPDGHDTGDLQYTPMGHPDVRTPSGQLLVSVSRNTTDYDELLRRPRLGRPYFWEVPLP
ncbi:DUF4185 domain-containing protein [Blastococcus sp. SYSU D00695]